MKIGITAKIRNAVVSRFSGRSGYSTSNWTGYPVGGRGASGPPVAAISRQLTSKEARVCKPARRAADLAEQVLGARAAQRRRAWPDVRGHEPLEAPNQHGRLAGVLGPRQIRRARDRVRDRDGRGLQFVAHSVAASAPVVERVEARSADCDVRLTQPPGTAEAVGDDHGRAYAQKLVDAGSQSTGGGVRIEREQHDLALAPRVRRVDAGVRAHEPVP